MSSEAISPTCPPNSAVMLHKVMRSCIDSSRIASPRYSTAWYCPPSMPKRPMRNSITGFAHPFPGDADDVAAFVVVGRKVVIGDHHHLARVPDFRAEALEHRLHAPRPARVVHHRQVDLAGDDLARRHGRASGRARDELLCKCLSHPCSRNSFNAFSGGFTKFERRLTLPAPSRCSLIASSALLAITVMPFTTGAPSISPENSIIGSPPAGTMTSAPASRRARHSRSHFGCSFLKPCSVEKASMKSVIFASTARTPI